jgi:signal transduction histidine kinase
MEICSQAPIHLKQKRSIRRAYGVKNYDIHLPFGPRGGEPGGLIYFYFLIIGGSMYAFYQYELKQRLQQAESLRLKELDEVKTKLYTNITHEFRTPLTVILGMAQQVIDNPKVYFNDGLKMIIRNGQNLLMLVNQMLDLSKLESGKLTLHYQRADIVSFLRYIVESFHSLAENKGVQLHFIPDSEPLIMDFDEVRLQQIISNILSNAIKFTPKGGHVYVSSYYQK